MQKASEDQLVEVLSDLRDWIRAAVYPSVKKLLQEGLPDSRSRAAYQMLDGTVSMEQVRVACKMSPNSLLTLANRWTAMGLMKVGSDKKRKRLFDLADFGLLPLVAEDKAD